jgi:cytochrome c oxidase assembly protein subunit 15
MGVSVTETRPGALWPLAVANLVANIAIVVTGGAVRLTASGLGCPTWPRCTERSFVPHGELGVHGVIEFGNRTLTFVLAAIAIACWVTALVALVRTWRGRRDWSPVVLSTVVALGVPAQAVVGGITVLTDLNPWIVSLHLLVSMAMIGVCVWLLDVLRGPARAETTRALRSLAWLAVAVGWVVLYVGTVVTGSGPHAGDLASPRNGLDPVHVSQLHADVVFLFVGLTVAMAYAVPRTARRPVLVLLGLQLAQSLVGFVQFFTDLPIVLVGIHLLGAALVSAAMTWVLLTVHRRGAPGHGDGGPRPDPRGRAARPPSQEETHGRPNWLPPTRNYFQRVSSGSSATDTKSSER